MKPSDLMIGDYVYLKNIAGNAPARVEKIREDFVTVSFRFYGLDLMHMVGYRETIDPIPITMEILQLIGFNSDDGFPDFGIWYSPDKRIELTDRRRHGRLPHYRRR